MGRDDFTKQTKDILAKRVSYKCSNPSCRMNTVGPNEHEEKATILGIAAHITAASTEGPRYAESLSPEQRKHISNGIWLCSNCAALIDKDERAFPKELIYAWKSDAEREIRNQIYGHLNLDIHQEHLPILEADLIFSRGMRANRGYSPRNIERFGGNIIPAGGKVIIYWELVWKFAFSVHNNSSFPAYNINIHETSEVRFSSLTKLPKINNLPPFESLDLEAVCVQHIEDDHVEADALMKQRIPKIINGLELSIMYENEARISHYTLVKVHDQEVINVIPNKK